jgi:hypothetical protein
MQLWPVPPEQIDRAWRDGAACLHEACDVSGGEITGSQLKMLLGRGERTLVALHDGAATVGWAVFRVDQLPNVRSFFITDLVAHNGHFEEFFGSLKTMAASLGCSTIRCAAGPAQARLYRMRLGFKPLYQILEVEV